MFYIHFIYTGILSPHTTRPYCILAAEFNRQISMEINGRRISNKHCLSMRFTFSIIFALHIFTHLAKVLYANLSFVLLAIMLFAQTFCMLISSTKKLLSSKFLVYVCAGNDRTQMITDSTDDYGASIGCQCRIETEKPFPSKLRMTRCQTI